MSVERFLSDYRKAVDDYLDEELEGAVSTGPRTYLSLLKAGLLMFAVSALIPLVIAFLVRGNLVWDVRIACVLGLALVLSGVGIYAFARNKRSEERYATGKRVKRLKQIAHELVTSDAYRDLKRDEAASFARAKAASADGVQKAISWVWKICYFLAIALSTFALAIETDFFGFTVHLWYAFVPAAGFVVAQLVHVGNEGRRCYLRLAAKVL